MADNRTFAYVLPLALLIVSNTFMTFAWYAHLKHQEAPITWAILGSWLVALMEYAFAVPANRIGFSVYTLAQLKTIQEVITLSVFAAFSTIYFGQSLHWQAWLGFGLIACGAALVFHS